MTASDVIDGYFRNDRGHFVISRNSDEPRLAGIEEIQNLEQFDALNHKYNHETEGENIMIFDYGPSVGGVIESVLFRIYTNGERILSMSAIPDFKERAINITGLDLDKALMKMERFNGFHSAAYSTLFCRTAEQILGIEVPEKVKSVRIAMMELERIASHLFVISRLCEAASQNIATYQLQALRERVLRMISMTFSHRYFFGVNRIGGIGRDIKLDPVRKELPSIIAEFQEILSLLSSSRIFIDRLQKTCDISKPWLCGPALRGSGDDYDARRNDPYYEGIKFKIVSENGSDSLSRFLTRAFEISESGGIINHVIENIDEVHSSMEKGSKDSGKALVRVETPSGDCPMYLEIQGKHVNFSYMRPPAILNMEGFLRGISGNVKTDFPFAYESFGIWISEMSVIS